MRDWEIDEDDDGIPDPSPAQKLTGDSFIEKNATKPTK